MSDTNNISTWARVVGVPLRPWSGTSPGSLILRGLISLAICGFLTYGFIRMLQPEGIAGITAEEASVLRTLVVPAAIIAGLCALYALLRVVVGALDLVPRRTVQGTVVSIRERKMGDFLPNFVQQWIWARGNAGYDRRKSRTELVLDTGEGSSRWTIRNRKLNTAFTVGRPVTIKVSPLVGYVADVNKG